MIRAPVLLGVVAVAGAGTMTVELAAVRLLAPWFGSSAFVWTNVIGVILLALSIGYLLGARLARRPDPVRPLALALLVGAAATAWLPLGARPVAELFMPAGTPLEAAAELLVWGSLAASFVLFLPAALVLGCVGPLAVEAVQLARGGHAGDAGGRVLAVSTLGSLAGTFGTTHVLVPRLGLDATFLGAAAALGLAGGALLVLRRRAGQVADAGTRTASGAALLALALGLALSRHGAPEAGPGLRLVAERQSPYQALRVVEELETGLLWLQVNESLDSFQSVWAPEPGLLPRESYYYNLFALPPWWARAEDGTPTSDVDEEWRVLVLGLGAGTAVRVLEGALPEGVRLASVGVEIDPGVVALGERWFDLERGTPERIVAAGVDARAALRADLGRFDQLVLDTYANNMEVPPHLSTVEFFGALLEALEDGAWLVVNAAGFGLDDPVVRALAHTLAVAFDARVLAVRVPFARNCVLFARRGAEPPEPGTAAWRFEGGPAELLLGPLELPGAWRWFEPGADEGPLLVDGHNPIELLQMRSIGEAAARRDEAQ